MIISDHLSSNIIIRIHFLDMIHFKDLRQKLRNIFLQFLVQIKILKFAFEII